MKRLLKEQTDEHVDTVKTRPPSSALLGIDSANRFQSLILGALATNNLSPNASPYDFNLYAPTNFIQGFFTRIAVSEITFPFAIPNINEFTNQIRFWYSATPGNATSYILTLTKGWYDFDTLATQLQTKMNAAGIAGKTFTVLYDDTQPGPSYTYSASVDAPAANDKIWFQPYYQNGYENQKGLFEMMNWSPFGYQTAGVQASSTTIGGSPTLLFTKYVDIVCANLTAVQDVRDGSSSNRPRDAICRLYLTDSLNSDLTLGSKPFNVLRQYTNPKFIKWENNLPVASLSFQVYNDSGYILSGVIPAAAGAYDAEQVIKSRQNPDWQMTMLLSEQ